MKGPRLDQVIIHPVSLCVFVFKYWLAKRWCKDKEGHIYSPGLCCRYSLSYGSFGWGCCLCLESVPFRLGLLYHIHLLAHFLGVAKPLNPAFYGQVQPFDILVDHVIWRKYIAKSDDIIIHLAKKLLLVLPWLFLVFRWSCTAFVVSLLWA